MTSEEIQQQIYQMGQQARSAALALSLLSADQKSDILRAMAASVRANSAEILEANGKDISSADERGITGSLRDRLILDDARIEAIAGGIEQVADLPDPVGEKLETINRPNGIRIDKVLSLIHI